MRRRAHRPLILSDPERAERNEAYSADIRARGDYRPERKVSVKIESAGERTWKFWCPGCDSAHVVSDSWNVNVETATISPSVLVYAVNKLIDDELEGDALMAPENVCITPRCHSFVNDGRIQFLGDSTHALSGQTVELPDWPTVTLLL